MDIATIAAVIAIVTAVCKLIAFGWRHCPSDLKKRLVLRLVSLLEGIKKCLNKELEDDDSDPSVWCDGLVREFL